MKRCRKWKTRLTILFISALYLLVVFAVWHKQNTERYQRYTIYLIPKVNPELLEGRDDSFWTALIDGANLAAEELNVNLKVFGTAREDDIDGQIALIEQCIGERPDAMLIAPADAERSVDVLQRVTDSGIRLILVDSTVDEPVGSGLVATDNYLAGKKLGGYVRTFIEPESQIGMVGHVPEASTAVDREQGMRAGLGKDQDKIVDVVFCGSSYDRACELTKELLTENPEIDIIMGMNEYSAVGAARAIREMGRAGEVKLVGFDNSIEQIQLLEQHIFEAIIIQKPVNMGYLSVVQAVRTIQGKPIEQNLDSGFELITLENMYTEENQRLLYPFSG